MYIVRATPSLFAISTYLVFRYLAVDGFDLDPLEFVFCSYVASDALPQCSSRCSDAAK